MNDDILSDWDNFDLDNNAEVIKVNNKRNSEIGVIQDSPFHDYVDVEIVIEDTGITDQNGIQIVSNGEIILKDNIYKQVNTIGGITTHHSEIVTLDCMELSQYMMDILSAVMKGVENSEDIELL